MFLLINPITQTNELLVAGSSGSEAVGCFSRLEWEVHCMDNNMRTDCDAGVYVNTQTAQFALT